MSTFARTWPRVVALLIVVAVAIPAAIASYRHAVAVALAAGEDVMAAWLPLSVDGLLLASLLVIWARRMSGQTAGRWPWFAFWTGMVATVAANLAAAEPYLMSYIVAIWPPVALAITLELVAILVGRTVVPPVEVDADQLRSAEEAAGVPVAAPWLYGGHVYRLYGDTDQLLYVGIADIPATRLGDHRRTKTWWSEVVRAEVEAYRTRAEALAVEALAIRTERPVYNIAKGGLTDRNARTALDRAEFKGPVQEWSEPVRVRSVPTVEDEHLLAVQELADQLGTRPTRQAVRDLTGVGATRADRLRNAVAVLDTRTEEAS
ncbi:MAG: DUF2637 domain-containing protein [Pseudonocardia sp.]|nr:DUF2637 domain-containing protein [Pseudonocardia sp.]